MAMRPHTPGAHPSGGTWCVKCMYVYGSTLVFQVDCPWGIIPEPKVKGSSDHGRITTEEMRRLLIEIGEDPDAIIGEAPGGSRVAGGDVLGQLGLSLEDLGL